MSNIELENVDSLDLNDPLKEERSDSLASIKIEEIKEDQLDYGEDYQEKTCSMKEGSIQAGAFSMVGMCVGTGAFSLGLRCTQVGCFWFIIFLIIGGIASYWTLSILIEAGKKVKAEEYSTAVKQILGKPFGYILDIIMVLFQLIIIIQMDVIVYSLIGRVYYENFANKENISKDFETFEKEVWDLNYIKYPIVFGFTLLISPLCILKDITKMRFASLFGICALSYTILVVVIQSPWFFKNYLDNYKEDDPETHANWFDISKSFESDVSFFAVISAIYSVFTCHNSAFPIYKTLKFNTPRRIKNLFKRAIGMLLVINLFLSICGFMTTPLKPKSLIIFRVSIFDNDIFMTIAKVSLALALYLAIPANYNSFRASFFMLVFCSDKIDIVRNIIVTYSVLFLCAFISCIMKDILTYLNIIGGFFCSTLSFLIPGILTVLSSGEKITSMKSVFTLIICGIMTLIGFIATIQTIIDMFSS